MRCFLHAQVKLRLQKLQKLGIKLFDALSSKFTGFHISPYDSGYKSRGDRKLRSRKCEGFTGQRFRDAVHFIQNFSRLNLGDVVV